MRYKEQRANRHRKPFFFSILGSHLQVENYDALCGLEREKEEETKRWGGGEPSHSLPTEHDNCLRTYAIWWKWHEQNEYPSHDFPNEDDNCLGAKRVWRKWREQMRSHNPLSSVDSRLLVLTVSLSVLLKVVSPWEALVCDTDLQPLWEALMCDTDLHSLVESCIPMGGVGVWYWFASPWEASMCDADLHPFERR